MLSVVEPLKAGSHVDLAAVWEVVAIPRRYPLARLASMLRLAPVVLVVDSGVDMVVEDSVAVTAVTVALVLVVVSDIKVVAMDLVDLPRMPRLVLVEDEMLGLEALTVVVAGMNATLEVPQAATVSL